jgi:membrane protein YdbS with pleckstrin-like domain
MKKAFKSKVDYLFLPVVLILAIAEIYMIYLGSIIGIVLIALLVLFFIYLYFDTLYTFTSDNRLEIKSGIFFHKEIYIKSIKKVRAVKHRKASPALSSDRLEISYNRYGRIVVSPNHQSEFIRELKEVNPRIRVEE